ncbi:DUF5825 family protein [Archangium gephyra]|uniref:DUF5825 family protein n=1 Tax=Archangium gephyra TaxID=48 RepID=UPI0035D50207
MRMHDMRTQSPTRLDLPLDTRGWTGLSDALVAGGRQRDVFLHLQGAAPTGWPSDGEIERLVALGVVEVEVPWWMELGEEQPEQSIHFVRFLRDAMSHGLRVDWRGTLTGETPAWALNHLEPPASRGEAAGRLAAWHEGHRYGLCYWRSGPGFVLVKDFRKGEQEGARFTLDDPSALRVFAALTVPRRLGEVAMDAEEQRILAILREEQLALQFGEWLVGVPYRMRRWPIPFLSI